MLSKIMTVISFSNSRIMRPVIKDRVTTHSLNGRVTVLRIAIAGLISQGPSSAVSKDRGRGRDGGRGLASCCKMTAV